MKIGRLNKDYFMPGRVSEWSQLQIKLPFLYRNSHWAHVCQRTEGYSLAEDWHDCL